MPGPDEQRRLFDAVTQWQTRLPIIVFHRRLQGWGRSGPSWPSRGITPSLEGRGTTSGKKEVERRREQPPRATHGAVAETVSPLALDHQNVAGLFVRWVDLPVKYPQLVRILDQARQFRIEYSLITQALAESNGVVAAPRSSKNYVNMACAPMPRARKLTSPSL